MRTTESDLLEGEQALLIFQRQDKLFSVYDLHLYRIVSRKGDLLEIERWDILLKKTQRLLC